MRKVARHWLVWLAGLMASLVLPGRASAREPIADYFRGLRSRGLYRLAEQYGLRRLGDEQLNVAEKSLVAVELSQTFASHALAEGGGGPDEEDLWTRAAEILRPAIEAGDTNPRRIEAVVQQAMIPIDRGLALSWRFQLFPDDAQVRSSAEASLRQGIRDLTAARLKLEEAIRADRPAAARIAEGAISPVEFRRLSERAAYQLAVAHVELGRVMPAGPERTETFREGIKQLEVLTKTKTSTALEARLQRVAAARLMGDLALATTLVNDLANDDLPAPDKDRVLAEQLRILIRQGQYADAIARVVEARKDRGEASDEVRAALVEAYLATWGVVRQKGDAALAADLWKQLQAEQGTITGPWRVYADLRVEQAGDVLKYGETLAGQLRTARLAYQAGDTDKAVEEFSKAVGEAMQAGQTDAAIEIASTRASILLKADRFADAAEAFRQIVERFPELPQGADASLLAAYALGRQADRQPTPEHRAAYTSALSKHLERYATHATADEARWMLALAREQQRDWPEVIRLLAQTAPDSPHAAESQSRLALAHVARWREARRTGTDLPRIETEAADTLSGFVRQMPGPPAAWTIPQSEIALKFAVLELSRRDTDGTAADRVLQRITDSRDIALREARRDETMLPPEWNRIGREVAQLRILSLARRERFDDARQILATLTGTSAPELLGVLGGLTELAEGLPAPQQRELGQLQLDTARRLQARRTELDDAARRQLDVALAQAYIATGNLPEAVAIYEALLTGAANPDKNLIRTVAGLLTRRGQPADLEKARGWWQKLETLERKGSREWLEVRLALGEALLAAGQTAECRKLIRVTRLLYPELGGTDLRERFDTLDRSATTK